MTSPPLAGISEALGADVELWDLLTTPLMLNVVVLSQGGWTLQALSEERDSTARRRRLLFDAYVVEVLARRRSQDVYGPLHTLRALRTLAVASSRLDTGVSVVRLDADASLRVLGDRPRRAARIWLVPMSGAVSVLVSTAAMGHYFSAAAGLVTGVVGILYLTAVIASYAETTGAAIAKPLLVLAYMVTVVVSACTLVLALPWLVSLLTQPPSALVAVIAFAWAVAAAGWTWLAVGPRWLLLFWIIAGGALVAATVLLLGAAPTALRGCAVGMCWAISLIVFTIPGTFEPKRSVGADKLVDILQHTKWLLPAVLVISLTLPRSQATPFWLPLAGWAVGVVYAYIPAVWIVSLVAGPFARIAMAIADEPVPWRRKFLRFAVDRGLLVFADDDYRFIHLLMRDHLGQCDPTQLAQAVLRRRSEPTSPVSPGT